MDCVTDIREVRVLIQFEKPGLIIHYVHLSFIIKDLHRQKKSIPINQTLFNSNNMFYALHTSDFKSGLYLLLG